MLVLALIDAIIFRMSKLTQKEIVHAFVWMVWLHWLTVNCHICSGLSYEENVPVLRALVWNGWMCVWVWNGILDINNHKIFSITLN